MTREASERLASFIASLGASGFIAVLNFPERDQCVTLYRNFPLVLGAEMLGTLAEQLDEPPPLRLN